MTDPMKKTIKKSGWLFFSLWIFTFCHAQQPLMHYGITLTTGYNGPEIPFWMRSNQFGNIPADGLSLGVIPSVSKVYTGNKKIDWAFSAEGRLNVSDSTHFIFTEGYLKTRLGPFEISGGRIRQTTGLCDTMLSSGSYSVSGNALGIPQIQISIPDFYTLPFLGHIFAIKGNYVHGWIGDWYNENGRIENTTPTYLHQKSLYARIGKQDNKLKLYGGFNHQVVWGNEKKIMGDDFTLSTFQTFIYANLGKKYNGDSIKQTRVGNSLGSIDLGFEYRFRNIRLLVYRQSFYDAGALYYTANWLDGLNGVSIINCRENSHKIGWKRFLIEFFYSKNQAGEKWSRFTPSPFEDYYNNNYYEGGWSYKGVGIGNPFITPRGTTRKGLPAPSGYYFINNRVAAIYGAFDAIVYKWHVISKVSYSINYGTYRTSSTGKDYEGAVYPSPDGVFPTLRQFSGYLKAERNLVHDFAFGFTASVDSGELFYDSVGFMAHVSKSF